MILAYTVEVQPQPPVDSVKIRCGRCLKDCWVGVNLLEEDANPVVICRACAHNKTAS